MGAFFRSAIRAAVVHTRLDARRPTNAERRIRDVLVRLDAPDAARHHDDRMVVLSGGARGTV